MRYDGNTNGIASNAAGGGGSAKRMVQQEAPGTDHSYCGDSDLFAWIGGDPFPTGMDVLYLSEDQGGSSQIPTVVDS
jgi:hypothetical protein